ncbi:hypothetical protein EC988_009862 [Linderina pennispora]|nr:hypothetical protein EC988_009862 [Linderina pennispora]
MESLQAIPDTTTTMLSRQGLNAQFRRRSIPRNLYQRRHRDSNASDATMVPPDSFWCPLSPPSGRLRAISDSCMSAPFPHTGAYAGGFGSASVPSSPVSAKSLHEMYSTKFTDASIEEEEDDDVVVIHNGVRRLTLSSEGYLLQGKPRLVNI